MPTNLENKLIGELNLKFVDAAFTGLPKNLAGHFKSLWTEYHKEEKLEDRVVKIADKLSLVAYCLEQVRLGNTYMVEILKNGMELLSEYKFSWLKPILTDITLDIKNFKIK